MPALWLASRGALWWQCDFDKTIIKKLMLQLALKDRAYLLLMCVKWHCYAYKLVVCTTTKSNSI